MSYIIAYLTFNGNCREAMNFYRDSFGGELYIQTVGESPFSAKMPLQMQDNIVQATLKNKELVIMASDFADDDGIRKGNNISLMLNCDSKQYLEQCYERLAEGCIQRQPIEETFWGALFGTLTDRYGNPWLFNFQLK